MNIFKLLFKTKKSAPVRVRNNNGAYARKVRINYAGQEIGHFYTDSTRHIVKVCKTHKVKTTVRYYGEL